MHGRPRKPSNTPDPAAATAKSMKLKDLHSQLLENHKSKLYTKEAVKASSKLLEINPEVYTAWNYRKLAFQNNINGVKDNEIVKGLADEELRTAEIALRRNSKSYGAWYHRKWLLNHMELSEINFDREFHLLDELLANDPRNFHGWNYRRFVTKLKNVPVVEELQFTKKKIDLNFSNYSAWHNRSAILSQLLKEKADGFENKANILTEEYELVCNALYTDPSDQSGWFYLLWLLKQTITVDNLLLISSWPSHESSWFLSIKKYHLKLYPSSSSDQCYSLHIRGLPIILCFNQAVSGVNSSNVNVNSTFVKNEDLIWSPLSTPKSKEAHCWVTFIKISEAEIVNSHSSTIEISIGDSSGIVSSSGSHCSHSLKFKFTIKLKSKEEYQIEEFTNELVTWKDDAEEYDYEHANDISFDKLIISEGHEVQVPKWNLETLSNLIELFRDPGIDSKFWKITLARLLICENLLLQKRKNSEEVLGLFDDLVKLDPSHAKYYLDERSIAIMNQVTSDKEFIIKHSWQSRCAGLQLSRLSLTRIGCVENLLWVQMLDLSHNELRSIEGLEALQLLICLNLSNNRISSFTSLEPLKLLKSLEILNISSNEIGSHQVDTWRYLCASPLSHTHESDHIIEELEKHNINVGDNWIAILLFKALNLIQLDIANNAIVDETFRHMLKTVLPALKWLDGVGL